MSKALEKTYDGIVIGAGHHGLILGTYLARAGLKILLVERRLTYGGGLSTREVTLPGFYHNLHSINHFHISETPWFKDLGLDERVTYITPRYELGQAHADGSALVLGRNLDESVANLARFSKKDAATFREWNEIAEKITAEIFLPERFSEPLPQAEREALLSKTALGRKFLEVAAREPLEVVRELFENEHVRLLFLFKVSLFGTWLVDTTSKTSPMGSVIRAFDLESGYQLCQGGSFNLARGLMESFIAAGGTYQPQVNIARIIIENNKATGIELAPLSLLDPTQAPPGKHTTYAWHVLPIDPDIGDQSYADFKEEFADKILETWAKVCPNMTSKNVLARYIYTGQEYVQELPNMREGDIFMGAFNADQVMYNHFGYRTPIDRLYNAGSAGHPGGAISGGSGYISAGVIAKDLGIKPWWTPWSARAALEEHARKNAA